MSTVSDPGEIALSIQVFTLTKEGSHMIMISHPQVVTDMILSAVATID